MSKGMTSVPRVQCKVPISRLLSFSNPRILDAIVRALWTKTPPNPFEAPYLVFVVPRPPGRSQDDQIRDTLVAVLDTGDLDLDFRLSAQTPWTRSRDSMWKE